MKVGAEVEGRYLNGILSEWYPAVVTGVNEWGMLALRYSDGDTADNVPSCHVRPRVKRAKEM